MKTEDFINIFRLAIDRVDAGFYDRSEWSNVNYAQKNTVKNKIIRFGERAFCYELYYHCRVLMEQYYQETQTSKKVRLQAELKKSQITDLIAKEKNVTRLDAEYYPDMLLHGPGIDDFSQQKVVVEIKANPNLSRNDLFQDLYKLDQFIGCYDYEHGVFLAINVKMSMLQEIVLKKSKAERKFTEISHSDKIIILAKASYRSKLEECTLSYITSGLHSQD